MVARTPEPEREYLSLQELQAVSLELLKDFDAFCAERGIEYTLCGGSMLGAARHAGFIPWDDDVDVMMLREEYEKLLALKPQVQKLEGRDLISARDRTFARDFARFVRTDYGKVEEGTRDDDCPFVGIDIFAIDYLPDSEADFARQVADRNKYRQLLLTCASPFNTGTTFAKRWVRNILRPFANAYGKYRIADKAEAVCMRYDDSRGRTSASSAASTVPASAGRFAAYHGEAHPLRGYAHAGPGGLRHVPFGHLRAELHGGAPARKAAALPYQGLPNRRGRLRWGYPPTTSRPSERTFDAELHRGARPQMDERELCQLGADQVPYFRTPEFSQVMLENERLFLEFADAPAGSRAVFLTASGTGGMEAAVMNALTSHDRALVVDGGKLGHRFVQLLEIHGIPHETISLPAGGEPEGAAILSPAAVRASRPSS